MAVPFADSPEFQRLLAGEDHVDLARVALEIGRDAYPEIDVEVYLERIHRLAERARARFKPGSIARDILGQINWVLFVEEEFRGNKEDYYDPRNSYLNEVLDRGLGIPITLSLVYGTIAERLGLAMAGVDLPVHFMLRVDDGDETCFVDPFHGGAVYDRGGCERKLSEIAERHVTLSDAAVEPCSSRRVGFANAQKPQGNLREGGRYCVCLTHPAPINGDQPPQPGELRDLGVLCVQADRLGEAIEPLQAYLELCPETGDATEIRELLVSLRREVSRWN